MRTTTALSMAMAAVTGLSLSLSANGASAGVELASHRANYQLSLHNGSRASGMQSVRGLLVMETREGCEGHISNQELAFVADLADAPSFNYAVRFSSWESIELDQLRFTVKSYDSGHMVDEFEGKASLDDKTSQAVYSKPENSSIELPADTIFPTEHMRKLVQSAMAGELVVRSNVFDGSGPDALTSVTAIIGRAQTVSAEVEPLVGQQSWPISLAYYGLNSTSDLPEFEISFNMTVEGILHDLVLDYGEFALAAKTGRHRNVRDASL